MWSFLRKWPQLALRVSGDKPDDAAVFLHAALAIAPTTASTPPHACLLARKRGPVSAQGPAQLRAYDWSTAAFQNEVVYAVTFTV